MRKQTKLKTPAADYAIPRDRDQADQFIYDIGDYQRALKMAETAMNEDLAKTKAEYEDKVTPIRSRVEALTKGLQTWAEAHRHELLTGDAKTVKLGNGEIAWRRRPPKVNLRGIEKILAWLEKHGLARFIRITKEVNKEAMLADPAAAQKVPGVSIGSEGEDFIVTPFEAALEEK